MKIGIIGTGLMGSALAKKLSESQHEIVVYNRTREKALALQGPGITVARTVNEVIQATDCSILMLADAAAIREMMFPASLPPNLCNKNIIQMGTISPIESIEVQRQVLEAGGSYLEAPVLGSIAEVKAGNLLVMVGGNEQQFERWRWLLACISREPILVGSVGQAAALKLALNQLIASLTSAFALSLSYVQRSGVDVAVFMGILRQSALYAPTFDKKLPRMLSRNFSDPNFPTKHLLKDVDLILNELERTHLEPAGLQGIRSVIQKALQMGLENSDYSAIVNAINPA